MMRLILFLTTNSAVVLIFGLILSVTGIQKNSLYGLLIFSALFGFSGAIVSLLMSKWIALKAVNGKIIKFPRNKIERWVFNTIADQAKKSRINMPEIAIYESNNINAFATGARKNASLIAISTELLKSMNIDETEAVLAHEVTHIANGDMVTMTLLQGIVNTFVMFISRVIARCLSNFMFKPRNKENSSFFLNSTVYTLISMFLEFTLGILANMIAMWFSRHREFYADAGAAKLVGCHKMIAALKRLQISTAPRHANGIAAFYINGVPKSLSKFLLSHPPLEERINALKKKKYLT